MCRPARRLFTLCAAASLLLGVLWMVGLWRTVSVALVHDGRHWSAGIGDGVLMLCSGDRAGRRADGWSLRFGEAAALPVRLANHGFYAERLGGWDGWAASAPMWFVVPIPLLLGVTCLPHRRRVRVGACPHCGYDLRGSPGRCPECGTAAAATAEAPAARPG